MRGTHFGGCNDHLTWSHTLPSTLAVIEARVRWHQRAKSTDCLATNGSSDSEGDGGSLQLTYPSVQSAYNCQTEASVARRDTTQPNDTRQTTNGTLAESECSPTGTEAEVASDTGRTAQARENGCAVNHCKALISATLQDRPSTGKGVHTGACLDRACPCTRLAPLRDQKRSNTTQVTQCTPALANAGSECN